MKDIKKQLFLALNQVWRRRRLALGVAWGICLAGWAFVALLPDQYVSEARFYVDTTSMLNPLLKGIAVGDDDKNRDQQVMVMQRTLTSRPNLLKVSQMTDLDKSATSEGQMQDLVTSLEERIKVKSQGTNLFLVQFTDNSPTTARNVVQALLTIFVESSTGDKREDIQTARSFLDTQIADYEKQLKAAEQRMADFKVKNVDFVSVSAQSFGTRLDQARQEAKAAKIAYEDAQEERDQIRRQLNATPQTLSLDSPVNGSGSGPVFMSSQQRLLALESRLTDLRAQYTEKHPDVIATKAVIEKLQREQASGKVVGSDSPARAQMPNELYTQLSMKLSDAETRTNSAKRKADEAQVLVDRMQKSAAEAPKIEAELSNLDRDYQVLKSSYENLLQRREYARIGAAADTTTQPVQFRLIAAPEVPVNASGPKRILFNSMVLLFGVLAGSGFVILLSQIDDHVNSPEDLLDLPGFRLLGCVSPVKTGGIDYHPLPLMNRVGGFSVAAAGLAFMFLLIVLASPNFSAMTSSLVMRLSS